LSEPQQVDLRFGNHIEINRYGVVVNAEVYAASTPWPAQHPFHA
jgi:hypothetical protein